MTQKILLLVSDMSIVRWILLGLPLCVLRINGFSLSVTRGYQDSIYTNIQPESTPRLICDDNVCKCKNGLTYIFDSDSLSGKCVRDYEIIKDRSKGKLLPSRWRKLQDNKKCIRVIKNETVANRKCNGNNLSFKWIWTIDEQMLNLKTLRCLKEDTRTVKKRNGQIKIFKQLSMEQCNKSTSKQKWVCPYVDSQDVRNKGTGNLSKWIKPNNLSYFQKCPQNIYTYKGCYRFSDGNHIKLMNKKGCDTLHNGTCGLKIQAPIDAGHTSCQLDWTESTYTISGFLWYPFNRTIIAGVQLTHNPVILQIKNISSLLSTWKGHLLKLNIKCTDIARRLESHCALLKVEGTATEEIPVSKAPRTTAPPVSQTTSQITSQPRSSMFEYRQINMSSTSTPSQKLSSTNTSHPSVISQDREENKDSSIILPIVIAAVALFCLLLALVVIVIVCKRRKRKNDDANQNEEHIYEEPHPVDNGPASPIYMEIDDITRSKSRKSNSSKKRNKSQSSETPPDPLYHTLEKPDRVKINEIYEELDDAPKAKSPDLTPQPFEKELDV